MAPHLPFALLDLVDVSGSDSALVLGRLGPAAAVSAVLCGLFLVTLTGLGLVAGRLLRQRGEGQRRDPLDVALGCGGLLAMVGLGAAGLLALAAALFVQSASAALDHNPVERITLRGAPARAAPPQDGSAAFGPAEAWPEDPALQVQRADRARGLHLAFELDGNNALTPPLARALAEWATSCGWGDARVQVDDSAHAGGRPVTRVDVSIPSCERDLREVERDVRRILPQANWADGVTIEFKGASRVD